MRRRGASHQSRLILTSKSTSISTRTFAAPCVRHPSRTHVGVWQGPARKGLSSEAAEDGELVDDSAQAGGFLSVLVVFAGPGNRPTRLAARLRGAGHRAVEVDTDIGGGAHDVLQTEVRGQLCSALAEHEFDLIYMAPPCESYMVGFKPQIRSRRTPRDWSGVPDEYRRYVQRHDRICEAAADLLVAAARASIPFIVENPADRAVPPARWKGHGEDHAPLWVQPPFRSLIEGGGVALVHSPHCAWGAPVQKWLTFMAPAWAREVVEGAIGRGCSHSGHAELAWGADGQGASRTKASAAYPPLLDEALALLCIRMARLAAERGEQHAVLGGRVADGPSLSDDVSRKVEAERARQPGFASMARREPASRGELRSQPIPGDLHRPMERAARPPARSGRRSKRRRSETLGACGGVGGYRSPLVPPRAPTAARPEGAPAGRIDFAQLFIGDEAAEIQSWFERAEHCQRQWREGHACRRIDDLIIEQRALQPWARGVIWDTRVRDDCRVVQRSDRFTQFPGRCIDRRALREAAELLSWHDAEIVETAGEGGVEVKSDCDLTTVLAMHHLGVAAHFEAADTVIQSDIREEWVEGPRGWLPFVPCRLLPRNVVTTERTRVLPPSAGDAPGKVTLEHYLKARVTQNSSYGDFEDGVGIAVNTAIPGAETFLSMPSVQHHAAAGAVIGEACRAPESSNRAEELRRSLRDEAQAAHDSGAGPAESLHAVQYAVDMESAFRFVPVQVADLWTQCFFWDSAEGPGGACVDCRTAFGGAFAPNRFERISLLVAARAQHDQRAFDFHHPFPQRVQSWRVERRAAQSRGVLPEGESQATPAYLQAFIDDLTGWSISDLVPIPPHLSEIEIGTAAMSVIGERPAHSSCRAAVHARIVIHTVRSLGFEASAPKTMCGAAIVVLGLLSAGWPRNRITCPAAKRAAMRDDIARQRIAATEGRARRKLVERLVGRAVHITQVEPQLVAPLQGGYGLLRASWRRRGDGATGGHRRVQPALLKLKAGGRRQRDWIFLR